ncbi:MAG: CoA transferase, partial [Candidatus Binatia bacterium]|nr:CoA transferase [Candidatus Binatia bacterium]
QALQHPQALAREMVVPIEHLHCGEIQVLGNPVKLEAVWGNRFDPPPRLGEHTREVLASYVGCSQEEMATLEKESVLQSVIPKEILPEVEPKKLL